MRTFAQRRGDRAEEDAAAYLQNLGWRIAARNIHVGRAEIDLLAVDPGPPPSIVAVEVRWRARRDFGLPEESVDRAKLNRVRAAALGLVVRGSLPDGGTLPRLPLRLDLVVIEPDRRLRHHHHVG